MDYFELKKTVFCMNVILSGAQIKSCGQINHKALGFHIRSESLNNVLWVELAGNTAGIYLVGQRLPNDSQTLLAKSFRNKVSGAYITGIDMPFPDRAVLIELKMAEWQYPRELWIEFFGTRSNIILVEKTTNKIIECLSNFPDDLPLHPLRMPGRLFESTWNRLKRQQLIELHKFAEESFKWPHFENSKNAMQWLLHTVVPMTPTLAGQLIEAHDDAERVEIVRKTLLKNSPISWSDWQIKDQALAQLELISENRQTDAIKASIDRAKNELLNVLKQSLKRCKRTLKAVQRDRMNLPDPDKIRRIADSVAADYHRLKQGMNSILVKDIHCSDGSEIEVVLNPKLNPGLNVEKLYKKAGKAQRALPRVTQRLFELEHECLELQKKINEIRDITSNENLSVIKDELYDAGFFVKAEKQVTGLAMLSQKPFLQITSPEGFKILVGKNARENDLLSFRHSSPTDFWLHAKGYRGAHVIVKNPNKIKTLPRLTCQIAAQYAVYYSKARGERGIPVYVTQKRYVRKAPGNIPGLAIVTRHETIIVDSTDPVESETK